MLDEKGKRVCAVIINQCCGWSSFLPFKYLMKLGLQGKIIIENLENKLNQYRISKRFY